MNILERIKNCGIVPVIVIDDEEDAINIARSLLDAGIDIAEITLRTKAAENSIKIISENFPEMIVGAGTVITEDQVNKVYELGAKFIVSPGISEPVIKRSLELGLDVLPGAITPSEIIKTLELGINNIKFFPSENYGGLKTIKSLSAPFTDLNFIPTGGINVNNLEQYLEFDKILAVGGSWICPTDLIKNKDFEEITRLSREAKNIVDSYRKTND